MLFTRAAIELALHITLVHRSYAKALTNAGNLPVLPF